ncbi:DNA-processing protein DprA [Microbacteriaceae bacterium 4G12]
MTASFTFAPDLPRIRRLVAAVTPPGTAPADDADHARDALARAAWTGIAEPGDRAATLLVSGLGAWRALAAVHAGATPAGLRSALPDTAEDALALPEREWAAALARWSPRLDPSAAERHLRQAAMVGAHLLTPSSALWPAGVDDLGEHAPIALWWRGIPHALDATAHSIALVGARAATGYGEHVAVEASAGLVDRGFAIVSGAAYGIDGTAHRAALASGGTTVAILAGGVDRFYPSGHDALLARIAREGAVVSELPCGSAPTRWRFLQRNRLIAACSEATVVLEAGWRSGSLNTAGHAAALGRPLGAVPGPVTSVSSAGCHRLLREYDAVCVTNADEMAELVGGLGARVGTGAGTGAGDDARAGAAGDDRARGTTSEERRVLDALSRRAARDELEVARRGGLSVAAVQSALGVLALEGRVAERPGGWVVRGE